MSEQSAEVLTLPEFLAWEATQPGRHELVGGRAYAMVGGSQRHSLVKDQLREAMGPMARERGCRPFGSDRRLVTASGNAYYPDLMICCGPATHDMYETDAVLVLEVLSPSTRSTDRREKLLSYAALASIEAYVMVEPDLRHFQVVRWEDGIPAWEELGPGDLLTTSFGVLSIDEIYDVVDSTAILDC
ncbi:MAG: Uma2 family endonuclease [Acidimicrobiales bacterium]